VLSATAAIATREPACNPNGEQASATDSAHNERFKRRLSDAEQEPNCHGRHTQQRQASANFNDSGCDEQLLS
jgi:hypothetical protein